MKMIKKCLRKSLKKDTYNANSQIKFKTSMLRSILCNYSDVNILFSGTITVAALAANGRNKNIQVVLKNCAPFPNCISEINNTKTDNEEVYGNNIEMNQLRLMLALMLIFLVIMFF